MIDALAGCAAVLLVVSGLAKLRRPAPAAAMLRALTGRRRMPASAARAAGAVETVVGAVALVHGGRAAFAVLAVTYAVLALVAGRLLAGGRRTGRRVACGCFGSSDALLGPAHLVLDAAGLAAGAAAAGLGTGALAGITSHAAPVAVVAAIQIVLLSWLAYLAVTELPALAARRRALTAPPTTAPTNGAP